MNERIVIFSGGSLGPWALDEIRSGDLLIGADRGALFLAEYGVKPDISLGDFDSVTAEQLTKIKDASGEVQGFDPVDKDYTDTELAFLHAISIRPRELVLVGGLGTRFDHSLANVHLLRIADKLGVPFIIKDERNTIRIVSSRLEITAEGRSYVSLLPLTMAVNGITLDGFRYPLTDATLEIGQSLGISNQLTARTGTIRIGDGLLLVIQSSD